MVSIVLLVISWFASDLYIQSTLGLKIVMNVDKAMQAQLKAEQEALQMLKEREEIVNRFLTEDPKTYIEKYSQRYAKEILGFLAESLIAQLRVAKYQISYAIPLVTNKGYINVQILSWSKLENP